MFTQRKRHLLGLMSAGAFVGWVWFRDAPAFLPLAVCIGAAIGFTVWHHDREHWDD